LSIPKSEISNLKSSFTFAHLMKILYSLAVIVLIFVACNNQGNDRLPGSFVNNPATENGKPTGNYPVITFDSTMFDFGNVQEGQKVTHIFKFKNSGTSNLVITDVRASCGCTSPKWPKEIIRPGNENEIEVQFNSEGKKGNFNKGITVYSNSYPNQTTIRIKGFVVAE